MTHRIDPTMDPRVEYSHYVLGETPNWDGGMAGRGQGGGLGQCGGRGWERAGGWCHKDCVNYMSCRPAIELPKSQH